MILKHMFDYDMMGTEKKKSMTKADIWFLFVLLAIALIMLLFFHLSRVQGSYAQISYDGRVLYRISLLQSDVRYYLLSEQSPVQDREDGMSIRELSEEEWEKTAGSLANEDNDGNYNVLVCRDGEIQMIQSNCPDLICVHHGAVSKTGENIICLPHKVVIEIAGGQKQKLDGVVY